MFDHLDDHEPWAADDELRASTIRRGRTLRRRRRQVGASLGVVGAMLASVVAGAALFERNLGRIDHVDVTSVGPPASSAEVTEPVVLVLVGVDSQDGLEVGDRDPARPASLRSDTVVVARLDPAMHRLVVLPIPRDLWVDIPGHPADRINAALPIGGPDLLVETIEQLLDVDIDHYLQVDFAGAIAIGDALGGVRLDVQAPLRDSMSGLALEPGCQALRGHDLLALGRSRHLAVQVDGRWRSDPRGDLGRIERQQAIAARVLAQLTELAGSDPVELYRLTDALADHLVVDAGLDRDHLVGLARALQGVQVIERRLAVQDEVHDGKDVLRATSDLTTALDGAAPAGGTDGEGTSLGSDLVAAVPRGC